MSAAPTACDDRLWCKFSKGCSNSGVCDDPDTYATSTACCENEFDGGTCCDNGPDGTCVQIDDDCLLT